MPRLRSESGMTLPEVLVTLMIALVVCFATFSLVEVVMKRSGNVADRADTTQRARIAMELITRNLRSQVCTDSNLFEGNRSVEAAGPTSLTLYTDFTDETLVSSKLPAPDRRTLTFDPTALTLTETVTKGDRGDGTSITFTKTPTSRQLLSNVTASTMVGTSPVFFKYYEDDANGEANVEVGVSNGVPRALTEDELRDVTKIWVKYTVLTSKNGKSGATTLQDEIYVRGAIYDSAENASSCTAF